MNLNTDHQKEWCQWFTPDGIAIPFLEWAGVHELSDNEIILEPSAGEGALVPDRPNVIAFELDPELVLELKYWRPQATVINADFLKAPVTLKAALALTNPPYSGVAKDGEGTFIFRCLMWAPRCCALIRTVALHGRGRFEKCWRFVRPVRIALMTERSRFVGPGGRPTDLQPFTDYMAIECVMRDEPLPLEAYDDGRWVAEVQMAWVGWKA